MRTANCGVVGEGDQASKNKNVVEAAQQ